MTAPATLTAAHALTLAQPVAAYSLTSGRAWSVVGVLLGLAGLVAAALARGGGRPRAGVVALAAGTAGAVTGGLLVAAAGGGPGSGSGIVGGVIALAVGLLAVALGGLARRSARGRA